MSKKNSSKSIDVPEKKYSSRAQKGKGPFKNLYPKLRAKLDILFCFSLRSEKSVMFIANVKSIIKI